MHWNQINFNNFIFTIYNCERSEFNKYIMANKPDNKRKKYRAPRGTSDYLPKRAAQLHYLDSQAAEIFERYGYRRIITPTFEDTDLFSRSIGESSDIVRKEMYTFNDKAGRSLTLRPEATAPVVRAYIEHKLHSEIKPVKLYYIGSMFRYERPQAGRYREFWQLGVEALGSPKPLIDAEVIVLLVDYLKSLALNDLVLHIGSMGDDKCRLPYTKKLRQELEPKAEAMCPDCQQRLKLNPLRVFDCKNKVCRAIIAEAPKITDNLCDECANHLVQVEKGIIGAGIKYQLDPTLVRGFDYYTRTTFEVRSPLLGAQSALGGGGRYDNLIAEYGGPATPAIGFALGMERVLLALEAEQVKLDIEISPDLFVAVVDNTDRPEAFRILTDLRRYGLAAEMDYMARSLRSQMKLADKLGSEFVIILGPDELKSGRVAIKNMATGAERKVSLDQIADSIKNLKSEPKGE